MGTSLGSCIAYLSFCTDQQLAAGVFNHVSSHFGDVVWSGSATRFIRRGLEDEVTRADLRECWGPISPWHYIDRRNRLDRPHLMITADFDTTFIPELAELVFQRYREHGLSVERVRLPCGHYTMAHPPFVYLDGWHICRYLTRHLS
jgi:pimeloyl-ACP methyl ester carboxylesterase